MTCYQALRILRRDPDIEDVQAIGDQLHIRFRKGTTSGARDRIAMLLYGRAPSMRRFDPRPETRKGNQASGPPPRRGRAA